MQLGPNAANFKPHKNCLSLALNCKEHNKCWLRDASVLENPGILNTFPYKLEKNKNKRSNVLGIQDTLWDFYGSKIPETLNFY